MGSMEPPIELGVAFVQSLCVKVVHNSGLSICSRLVNDVHRVAILPTKHRLSQITCYSTTVYTAILLFVRAHADKIDWRLNGRSFTKSGRGQAKIFAALCAPNNMNPPFKNPGSTTVPHVLNYANCL